MQWLSCHIIVCQRSRNLVKRVPDFPPEMHLDFTPVSVTTVIPKFTYTLMARPVKVAGPSTSALCSGVMARPNNNSLRVRLVSVCMRSLSWQIASSKCLGHKYGSFSGSYMSFLSIVKSMSGEQSWRRRPRSRRFRPSTKPLFHGAYAGVVMCLMPHFSQNWSTSPFQKWDPLSAMNVSGVTNLSVIGLRNSIV